MEIEHRLEGDGRVLVVVVPDGLTHETAGPVRSCAQNHLPNTDGAGLVLDMSRVRLISSLGVAALLQIQEHCQDRGAEMRLACLQADLRRFVDMLGLESRFVMSTALDDAVFEIVGR